MVKGDIVPFIVANKLNLYFRLRRSLRVKRLQLRVHDNGFEVVAPKRVLNREIISFVWDSRHWMARAHSRRLRELPQDKMRCSLPEGIPYHELEQWFQAQTYKIIDSVVQRVCPILDRWPTRIVLKQQKTCWGSCGINNAIHINWRLIFAPEGILEYVVVHELCHLLHRNHGIRFWKTVAKFFPDHVKARKWLRKEGNFLMNINIEPSFWNRYNALRLP